MKSTKPQTKDSLRDIMDLYISKWKIILMSTFVALVVAFFYLRYTNYQYESTASIKLKDENNKNRLSEITAIQDYGIFSNNFTNVLDEIQIIKSRSILAKVVDDLNLNIKFFVSGRVIESEVYLDPPLNINIIASDSVIHQMDTVFFVTIIDENKYKLSNQDSKKFLSINNGITKSHVFGDRIKTSAGDMIITPNIGAYGTTPGSQIRVAIKPLDLVVENYKSKIKLSNTEQSNVLTLSLRENIKRKAELILDKVIETYNEDAINDKEKVVQVTSDFINNRLKLVSTELEEVDLTAENLKQTNRLSDLGTQSNIFLQTEKENEKKLVETTNQIQLIDYMSDYINSDSRETDLLPANVGIADNNVSIITQRYNDLVLQRDRLLENSTEKNPTVINLNNEIAALKNNLDQSLKNLKSSSEITLDAIKREDARISSRIFSTPRKERQFRNIERQQSIKESLFLYLLEKREETAITLGMSSPNAKIVESAFTSSTPVSPKKKIVYLAALLLGLFIPISVIYAMDLMDTKIHNKEQLERYVKAPFIGDIPKSSTKKKDRLISKVDYSPKAEAFRMVRTNIDFMLQGHNKTKAKTIFVTSTTAQEGKSHTSVNLAQSLSFSEKKVLLIETDIRVPKVQDYLNLNAQTGITDYISNPDLKVKDVTIRLGNNQYLDVIPAGTIPPNPTELLMNDRVKLLFEEVETKYDYIVVDTAAVGLVTDTVLISKFADIFIYVVNASTLDKRQLHVAQTMYEEKRLPNMTMLLNATEKRSGYGYGYGYGSTPEKKMWYQKILS